jgi:hypothetical protein
MKLVLHMDRGYSYYTTEQTSEFYEGAYAYFIIQTATSQRREAVASRRKMEDSLWDSGGQ